MHYFPASLVNLCLVNDEPARTMDPTQFPRDLDVSIAVALQFVVKAFLLLKLLQIYSTFTTLANHDVSILHAKVDTS
jgi:hypothetical protein